MLDLFDQFSTGFLLIRLTPISHQKSLIRSHEELERRVEERTRELVDAERRLRELPGDCSISATKNAEDWPVSYTTAPARHWQPCS